jgi:hypothetical protein
MRWSVRWVCSSSRPGERARLLRGSVATAVAAAALAVTPRAARAADTDTSYGRVQGDLGIVVGAGATVADGGPRAEGEMRLRYLETAGVFATYEDGPALRSGAEPRRVFATGLEVRPLFLFRWLKGHETSREFFDLLVDSMGIELGAAFVQPSGTSFQSRPALQAGLMVEVPLFGAASGPWLGIHGGGRWSDGALQDGTTAGPDDRSFYLSFSLAWHQVVLSHVVDVGDRGPLQ